jgi:5-methylcytosine-specific restriction enzyme subunit McrC
VTPPTVEIRMTEWDERGPDGDPRLVGLTLSGSRERVTAAELSEAGMLEVSELRAGLSIRSFSFVGTVRLGTVAITVVPKLKQTSPPRGRRRDRCRIRCVGAR